jgi:hypothetical protein
MLAKRSYHSAYQLIRGVCNMEFTKALSSILGLGRTFRYLSRCTTKNTTEVKFALLLFKLV